MLINYKKIAWVETGFYASEFFDGPVLTSAADIAAAAISNVTGKAEVTTSTSISCS